MKILMISRATLFTSPGGDTIQLMETASHLRQLNVEVDVKLTNTAINYEKYHLIHFFNIIRPADILIHIKRSRLPYVVSTIFVDYSELEKSIRKGLGGWITRLLEPDTVEYLKAILRFVINGEKINSFEYTIAGHKRSVQKVIKNARLLLPNSASEYHRLINRYKIKQHYRVIPNAINTNLFQKPAKHSVDRTVISCVARIEPIKNQLNLIRALNGTQYKLLIVGRASPNNLRYYNQCKIEASDNVVFIDHIDQVELVDIYYSSKVHILPSWFETTGLSSLEAAVCGCNIVITDKGDTKEYFKDFAYYCNPGAPASILKAIDKAFHSPVNDNLQKHILTNFTWEKTAVLTLEAYNQALQHK
jgi:glycosyltransferase involved in cell wall biosynthesis